MNDVLIYGEIGWEVTARTVRDQLAQAEGPITVRVNSPGGDVYEGIAILNALREYDGDVTVIIESAALSAASFIAVGCGARVIARPYSEVMIHKAWTMAAGNADAVRKTLADLDRQDRKLAEIYASRGGGDAEQWLEVMAAETWYTAQEALDAGLVDEIQDARTSEKETVSAFAGSRVYASCKYGGREDAPAPKQIQASRPGEETNMSILNQLAGELGKSPDEVREALSGFFNQSVEVDVDATVEVSYPDDVRVAPTEVVTVEPVTANGEPVPEGVEFLVESAPEGYDVEIDEAGVVAIAAPSGAEPGDTVEVTISVNGAEVGLGVEIRAVTEETEDDAGEGEAPAGPLSDEPAPVAGDTVTLDRETYNELRAAAQHGWKAAEDAKAKKLDEEVDQWVREGRISAALRNKARAAIHRDAQIARDLYGANPKNTVPRGEVGYGSDPEPAEKTVDLRGLAQSRLKKN